MNVKHWLYTGLTGALVLALLAGVGLMAGPGTQTALAQGGEPPYLGIRFENTANGARIAEVIADSPAAAAGLQPGDLITAIDGEALSDTRTLIDVIDAGLAPDDTITLSVERDGETLELEATLGVRPADFESMAATPVPPSSGQGNEVRRQYFRFGGATFARLAEGWRVDAVESGSAAADAGLEVGDLVKTFNDTPTPDVRLGSIVQLGGAGGEAVLSVERGGETLDLTLTLEAGAQVESYEATEVMPESGAPMQAPEATPEAMPDAGPDTTAPVLPPSVTITDNSRGYLGVSFITLTPEVLANLAADDVTLAVEEGAVIMQVEPATPAEDAGLQVDDVITAVNGEPVDQERTLADRIYAYEAGDTITLDVARGDETLSLDVTLAARPRELNMPNIQVVPIQPRQPNNDGNGRNGFMLPFGLFFTDPNFDLQAYLEAHPELQDQVGDLDLDALTQALQDLRQGLSDLPRGERFDWEQFLQDHPVFNDLLSRLGENFNPDEMGQMLPGFPWFGNGDPFHHDVDPLQSQEDNAPA